MEIIDSCRSVQNDLKIERLCRFLDFDMHDIISNLQIQELIDALMIAQAILNIVVIVFILIRRYKLILFKIDSWLELTSWTKHTLLHSVGIRLLNQKIFYLGISHFSSTLHLPAFLRNLNHDRSLSFLSNLKANLTRFSVIETVTGIGWVKAERFSNGRHIELIEQFKHIFSLYQKGVLKTQIVLPGVILSVHLFICYHWKFSNPSMWDSRLRSENLNIKIIAIRREEPVSSSILSQTHLVQLRRVPRFSDNEKVFFIELHIFQLFHFTLLVDSFLLYKLEIFFEVKNFVRRQAKRLKELKRLRFPNLIQSSLFLNPSLQ